MVKSAIISPCCRYRYLLTRRWQEGDKLVVWVMLNPSTADANLDDPTIRRVIDFSKRWGFDACHVVNLFALRSTDPKALLFSPDPIGPENINTIKAIIGEAEITLCAWGNSFPRSPTDHVDAMTRLVKQSNAQHLGLTKSGQPKHPLYIAGATSPVPFT